jgi:hypothetical protein
VLHTGPNGVGHGNNGSGHAMHTPIEQEAPGPQRLPQPPQLVASICAFKHVGPIGVGQSRLPEGHTGVPHWPLLHGAPCAHALKHAPQLFGSLSTSTHAVPIGVGQK